MHIVGRVLHFIFPFIKLCLVTLPLHSAFQFASRYAKAADTMLCFSLAIPIPIMYTMKVET